MFRRPCALVSWSPGRMVDCEVVVERPDIFVVSAQSLRCSEDKRRRRRFGPRAASAAGEARANRHYPLETPVFVPYGRTFRPAAQDAQDDRPPDPRPSKLTPAPRPRARVARARNGGVMGPSHGTTRTASHPGLSSTRPASSLLSRRVRRDGHRLLPSEWGPPQTPASASAAARPTAGTSRSGSRPSGTVFPPCSTPYITSARR